MRSYFSMISYEDQVRNHPYYSRAAIAALDTFIELLDSPFTNTNEFDDDNQPISAAEKKKMAKKLRKKQQQEQDASAAATANASKDKKSIVDTDPKGLKHIENVDFVAEALKFCILLQEFCPKTVDVWVYSADIYLRQGISLVIQQHSNHRKPVVGSQKYVQDQISR